MNNKQMFFIDFDATLTNSLKAYCDTYNYLYHNHPDFKQADYTKVNQYDLKDECFLVKNPLDIFEEELFFNNLEFINENTYDVLRKLNEKYKLIIASIGTPSNIAHKAWWLEENLPFIKDYVFITNQDCKMNKSLINMNDSVFLDDIPENLESSNAKTKVLFGKKYSWNECWQGDHCLTWTDVEERFLK